MKNLSDFGEDFVEALNETTKKVGKTKPTKNRGISQVDTLVILPCPFCNCKPTYEEFRAWFYFYRFRCKCGLTKDYICDYGNEKEKNKAIKLWNTRSK